ncbi:STAS domain-containing protein [Streptomyces sp. NBC_00009]|uniref:STAS domain-containing protein n=1 Tax=Streptomyces sp. NBC_00009 TaxID=2975620 RepID=UPI003251811C
MSFNASFGIQGTTAVIRLAGQAEDRNVSELRGAIDAAVAQAPRRLVIDVNDTTALAPAALRCLAFAQQQLPATTEIAVDGASAGLRSRLGLAGLDRSMTIIDAPVPAGV